MKDDPRASVRALLAAAGLSPSEEEVAAMVVSYPTLRARADSLFTEEISRFLPSYFSSDEDLEER